MAFTKESAARAGAKSKRGPNKINPELKEYMNNEGSIKLLEEMRKLEGNQFIDAWSKVSPYLYPKLQNTVIEADIVDKRKQIQDLFPDELDE